jgi:putative tryptophan/tyrosine transport system substrate-binding protein
MKRREFIALVGTVVACPLVALAQQADGATKKLPRIGFLASQLPSGDGSVYPFIRGLRDYGYVDGQNLIIEYRVWQGDKDNLAKHAIELAADHVDLILASSTIEALAAKRATTTIPIVIVVSGDPVGAGLAASLARPGGNVTGLSSQGNDTMAKSFSLLAEIIPEASLFAVLMDPDNRLHAQLLDLFEREAAQRHVRILPVAKRSAEDIAPAFATMAKNAVQGTFVFSDPVAFDNRRTIVNLAAKYRIPSAYMWRVEAVEGGLLAYGPDIADLFRRAAGYVAKLLQGAKAAELPIEQAERFQLVINLKTAKALGLTIPPTLLARADEVIE